MVKVMIVDDAMVIRSRLRKIFTDAGYFVVSEIDDGSKVNYSYKEYKPDIVTMDITMNKIDGLVALQNLLTAYPDAKVLMITAVGQKMHVLKAIKSGAKGYIIKPFDDIKVISAVENILKEGDYTAI